MCDFFVRFEVVEIRCFRERDVILMRFRGVYGKRKIVMIVIDLKSK